MGTATKDPRGNSDHEPREAMALMGRLGFSWGIGGVVLLLTSAIFRLVPIAAEPLARDLEIETALGYFASVVLFGYAEGYRGFQLRFAPRVVARGGHLGMHPRWVHVVLAPFFCMGLLHATTRRMTASWGLAVGIALLVAIVGALPQPWRGIIDAGVSVGIAWGTLSIVAFWLRALVGRPPTIPLDLPEGAAALCRTPPRPADR